MISILKCIFQKEHSFSRRFGFKKKKKDCRPSTQIIHMVFSTNKNYFVNLKMNENMHVIRKISICETLSQKLQNVRKHRDRFTQD